VLGAGADRYAATGLSFYPSTTVVEATLFAWETKPNPHHRHCSQLTYEDLSRLHYLNAVIDETMRIFPVAATGSVRWVLAASWCGSIISPGAAVNVNPPEKPLSPVLQLPPHHSTTFHCAPPTHPTRETTAPTHIGPYRVPAGIVVWPMIYALQNARHNGWDAPSEFRPVRA
jgi:hypothetical protein